MPLNLTEEEKNSLGDGVFVAGTGISQLMQHYNPSQYNVEQGIVSNIEELNHALTVQGNRIQDRIILLHVNALSSGFSEGENNHYVGLRINRQDNERYRVQYIDPMGGGINHNLREAINNSLGTSNIQEYSGGLQHARIVEESNTRRIEGNSHDCGPMLVYLLTRATHEQSLPTAESEEESIRIGRHLRRTYLNDNIRSSEITPLHKIIPQDMSTLIYVPQGCYAEISSKTPGEISGLMTSGMGPCCHIIVANKANKHMFLCHADSQMDLTDKDHGIVAWIKAACSERGDYQNIIVNIGEKENESRHNTYDVGQGKTFYEQVRRSLDQLEKETGVHIDIETHNTDAGSQYGILLSRKNNRFSLRTIDGDTTTAIDILEDEGYEIKVLKDPHGGFTLESSIQSALRRRKRKDGAEVYPPICVFDGSSGNSFLSLDNIANRYSNYDIEWNRVERHAPSVSSSSEREIEERRKREGKSLSISNNFEGLSPLSSDISSPYSSDSTHNSEYFKKVKLSSSDSQNSKKYQFLMHREREVIEGRRTPDSFLSLKTITTEEGVATVRSPLQSNSVHSVRTEEGVVTVRSPSNYSTQSRSIHTEEGVVTVRSTPKSSQRISVHSTEETNLISSVISSYTPLNTPRLRHASPKGKSNEK